MGNEALDVVFLGSPPFATVVFERLVDSRHRVRLLVTPPDRAKGRGKKVQPSELVVAARERGISVLQPRTVKDDAVVAQLEGIDADVFVVVAYGELLREAFLAIPKHGSLNVHPSLLPRWRGATPIPAAVLAGDEITGTSIQRMVLKLDAGDVVVQEELAMDDGETAGELAARLAVLSAEALVRALDQIAEGSATFSPQEEDGITICRKLKKSDGALDWTQPAIELERRVRAMNPWPGASTRTPAGEALRVWSASVVDGDGAPGTVLASEKRLVIATGGSALELIEVQAPGKRAMPAADYLRGNALPEGSILLAPEVLS